MIVVGVVTDTHIPDRTRWIHPGILARFREERVQAILHAGDVCVPGVLAAFEEIAPVYAVRGNRDWLLRHLPVKRIVQFGAVRVGMAHGHGSMQEYLADKWRYLRYGLNADEFIRRIEAEFPEVDAAVFGHIHLPINLRIGNKLIFNPGSACCPHESKLASSAGLLHIDEVGQSVEGQIFTFV